MRLSALILFLAVILITVILFAGCSSIQGNDAVLGNDAVPGNDAIYWSDAGDGVMPGGGASDKGSSHQMWGMWQFTAFPEESRLEALPLRTAEMHLNALPFLEPPPLLNLTLESLEFNGNIIEADIGLRHPFLGLNEFTGFDVCGILISNGTVAGFDDPDLRMAGENETRLLNPDGYSRWWNPAEFPQDGTMFGYKDGLLGAPDSHADYNCTLNGYKYFCDDLDDPDDPPDDVTIAGRGVFSAGQKNGRHYTIEIGSEGLIFNYAIDASWKFPGGDPPWVVPDDFGPEANRPEAWRIVAGEIENTLWNDGVSSGGNLSLGIDVFDWQDPSANTVRVESPGNFGVVETSIASGGGEGYSTYQVDITDATPAVDEIELLISVVSDQEDFAGFVPGVNTTAYFTSTVPVAGEQPESPCKNVELRPDATAVDIALDHTNGDLLVVYSDDQIWRHEYVDNCYGTGVHLANVASYNTPQHIDMTPNRFIVVGGTYSSGYPFSQCFDSDGNQEFSYGHGGPAVCYDVFAMGSNGTYENDLGPIPGREWSGAHQIIAYRAADEGWWPPTEHQYYEPIGSEYGYNRLYYLWVVGAESDRDGNYLWFAENEDWYAARWEMTPPSSGVGSFAFDNAYFGTGSQTDADNGWNDARDITRDDQNRYFILDELSSGNPRVKLWSVDGDVTTSLGGFGNSMTISGSPLRIEGSDFNGNVVVLHGDAAPYMISVFFPNEMPD